MPGIGFKEAGRGVMNAVHLAVALPLLPLLRQVRQPWLWRAQLRRTVKGWSIRC